MGYRVRLPKSPLEYPALMSELLQESPWRKEGKTPPELVPQALAAKISPRDRDRSAKFWNLVALQAEHDLFFFGRFISDTGQYQHADFGIQMDRPYLTNPKRFYLFELYREYQRLANTIDPRTRRPMLHRMWLKHARRHFKTTVKTDFLVQQTLRRPNIAIVFYSKRKEPMAVERLDKYRLQLETNRTLHALRPELFWAANAQVDTVEELKARVREEAKSAGVRWSDTRITLRRQEGDGGTTRSDPTAQAAGILNGPYTGGGSDIRDFDDCVDGENAEGILAETTVRYWIDSFRITNPSHHPLDLIEGTPWAAGDPYVQLVKAGFIRRTWSRSAFDASRPSKAFAFLGGYESVFLTRQELEEQRGDGELAREAFALQYWVDVDRANRRPLSSAFVCTYDKPPREMALGCPLVFIMDPGGRGFGLSPARRLSNTAWYVVAVRPGGIFAVVDGGIDLLTPTERAQLVVDRYTHWRAIGLRFLPAGVRIEQPGQNADGESVAAIQEERGVFFDVWTVPRGRLDNKVERVYNHLEPLLNARRLYLPTAMPIRSRGKAADLVAMTKDEIDTFPAGVRNDAPDCLSLLGEAGGREVYVYRGGSKPRQEKLPLIVHPQHLETHVVASKPPPPPTPNSWMSLGLPGNM